jgi:hypothetical protein
VPVTQGHVLLEEARNRDRRAGSDIAELVNNGTCRQRTARVGESVYSRKISVQHEVDGRLAPAPLKWLDSFAMRSFTNDSVFDDTLPVADGVMEIGARVPLDRLRESMEDWFRRKSYLAKDAKLVIHEMQ